MSFLGFLKKIRLPDIYFVFPGSRKKSKKKTLTIPQPPALILDTSVIIDGRIADVAKTGFLFGTFVVPACVLEELQKIADSKNILRRNRGRRGLEVLEELKKARGLPFKIMECGANDFRKVDSELIKFAKRIRGRVLTVDYNLNKVGKVTGVKVLNINELANMVKTIVLPGEELEIEIIQNGKEPGQGVGYLPDGTMVVVENGVDFMGKVVKTEAKRIFQTEAGRMIFVKIRE